MNDKRHLYRGFHPDQTGKTTISLNGKTINGFWVYGDLVHNGNESYIHPNNSHFNMNPRDLTNLIILRNVLTETIGQWVTTDVYEDDVFEGDIVRDIECDDCVGEICFSEGQCEFCIESTDGFGMCDIDEWIFEVIGNKWEWKKK